MSHKAGLSLSGFERTTTQAPRFFHPAEQEVGAAQCTIGPATMLVDLSCGLPLEELLGLVNSAHRNGGFADLRQHPSRRAGGPWTKARPLHRAAGLRAFLDQQTRLRTLALGEVAHACRELGKPDGMRMLRWFGELDRLRLISGRLGESAKFGKTHGQVSATEDRCRHGHAEIFM